MKKIFIAIAAIAVLASCDKEASFKTLKFTAKVDNTETKATLGDKETKYGVDIYPVVWEEGDEILVTANNGAASAVFTLSSGAGETDGTFAYTGTDVTEDMSNYVYTYPVGRTGVDTVQVAAAAGKVPAGAMFLTAKSSSYEQEPLFNKRSALVRVKVTTSTAVENADIVLYDYLHTKFVDGEYKPASYRLTNCNLAAGTTEFLMGVDANTMIDVVRVNDVKKNSPEEILCSGSSITTINFAL